MKIIRRCNVWDMEDGEHCFHQGPCVGAVSEA